MQLRTTQYSVLTTEVEVFCLVEVCPVCMQWLIIWLHDKSGDLGTLIRYVDPPLVHWVTPISTILGQDNHGVGGRPAQHTLQSVGG